MYTDLFKVQCKVSNHCVNEGASCRNCLRNENVKPPTDNFRTKVTIVDFVNKKIVLEEGEKLPTPQTEFKKFTSDDLA